MRVRIARALATEWVKEHVSMETWFRGAYFSGSTIGLPDDAELSVTSDIDIVIVTSQDDTPLKLGKFVYKDTLKEVTYLSLNHLTPANKVLISYHLAGSFRLNTIIADPTGHLQRLQLEVSRHFAEKKWVLRRCENALQRIENGLLAIDTSTPWHDQVTAWLFQTGVTTHVILVAALHNPTVRRRYYAAHEVLLKYGHSDLYLDLLKLLGCVDLTPKCVEGHLDELSRTFDATASVAKTPFFFSSDITPAAKSIAIDGSCELIRSGYHREAVFWIVATFARCHKILAADAPDLQCELAPAFDRIVADLGITSYDDLIHRSEDVIQFLPRLWQTSEAIIGANPDILAK